MRIHIVSQAYDPEPEGFFVADLARHWAGRGHEVTVLTAAPASEATNPRVVGGLPFRYSRRGFAGRLLTRATFAVAAARASARTAGAEGMPDVVLRLGSLPAPTWPGSGRGRRPVEIRWVLDREAEVLAGLHPRSPVFLAASKTLGAIAHRGLSSAEILVTLSPRMAEGLTRDYPRAVVRTIPLWAPRSLDRPEQHDASDPLSPRQRGEGQGEGPPLVPPYVGKGGGPHDPLSPRTQGQRGEGQGEGPPLVAGYHGNLGLVYDFAPILEAARLAGPSSGIRFRFVGDGSQREQLDASIRTGSLGQVERLPPVSFASLPDSLAATQVQLVPLRSGLEGSLFPAKVLSAFAAGVPVVFIGDPSSEVAALLRDTGAGVSVPPDGHALLTCLQALKSAPERLRDMSCRAHDAYRTRFRFAIAAAAWDGVLEESSVVGRSRPSTLESR